MIVQSIKMHLKTTADERGEIKLTYSQWNQINIKRIEIFRIQ